MGEKLAPLPEGPYDVILADPPWLFRVWKRNLEDATYRGAERHYPTLDLEQIKSLSVQQIVSPDSILFLWACYPMLDQAMDTMRAWGFTFKTVAFTWIKTGISGKFHVGLGYYTRANAEICLLGSRGKPLPRVDKGVRQLIVAERRAHSQKPDEARTRIERLFGNVPRIELFARQRVSGWDAWGLGVDPNVPAIW